jgi:hypothetical protein
VRRLRPESIWPELSARPGGPELVDRWEALLDKAPRLRPFVDEMLGRHRLRLQESGAAGFEIEQTLWQDLAHWLADFEALPGFAVSAIAVTLEDDAAHEVDPAVSAIAPEPVAASPEQAVGELETLLSDAAFALAFHCVDACLRPRLPDCGELARVPEPDWFALLRASARPQPALTPEVAITLVLHVLSPQWARNPADRRHAALRLFLARPDDLRGDLKRLCSFLPTYWGLEPEQLATFVAAAGRARVGLADASALCSRIVASVRARPGGLALLADASAAPATPEELGALFRNVRKYRHIGGFQQLLCAL